MRQTARLRTSQYKSKEAGAFLLVGMFETHSYTGRIYDIGDAIRNVNRMAEGLQGLETLREEALRFNALVEDLHLLAVPDLNALVAGRHAW